MILVQPLILILAALAAAVLILAYYLQRQKAPKLFFSAVRFLPRASPARAPRAAMPPLRLLVPALILALAILPLAQPMVSQLQPSPLGLIIDDSAFMPGKGQVILREVAIAVANKMSSGTHWGVFTTSGRTVASGTGKQSLISLLNSYSMSAARTFYSPTIFEQAVTFLRERAGAVPVLLLVGGTDTFSGYPGLDNLRPELEKEGVRLLAISSQGSTRPAFIAAMDMPQLARLGTEVSARIGVANTSSESLSGELCLMGRGNVLVQIPVKLPPQSLKWHELKISPQNSGINRYEIVLSLVQGTIEDRVTWEPAAFAAQKVVILASASNASPGYVEKAFRASPVVEAVTVVEPEALDLPKLRQFLSSSLVVVMDGVDAALFSNELGAELRGWVESGGVLVFAYGSNVTDAWNKHALSSVLPAAFKTKKRKLLQGVAVKEQIITSNLELESVPLTVRQWLSVEKPSNEQVLMSVGGEPMLLIRKVKEGTVLLWASTTAPKWNNWVHHPSFPVFWSNVMVYAISGDTRLETEKQDSTRALWRAAVTSTPGEKVYYVKYKEGEPITLPAALQGEVEQPVRAYRDYHVIFIIISLLLALGYLWFKTAGRRRVLR